MRIHTIANRSIDLDRVIYVTEVGGDPSFLSWKVYLEGGYTISFLENRQADKTHFLREDFMTLWKGGGGE